MKRITSISPSSAETDEYVDALPSPQKEAIQGYINELQRRRDTDCARGERVRAARRDKVTKAIKAAAADIAARLRALPPEKHAEEIEAQIDVKPGHYGLRKTPSLELIQDILDQNF